MRERTDEAERAAIAGLEPTVGPLAPHPSGLPIDGPRTLWHGEACVAWAASAARVRDELAGAERAGAHPAAPRVAASSVAESAAIAWQAPGFAELEDPIEALVSSTGGAARTLEATVREHLESLGGPVSVPRALARIAGRSRADRLLAQRAKISTRVGPILGGVHPGWLRSAGRPISLTMRHARAEGWTALDLAAADAHGLADLRLAHADRLDATDAGRAYDLALLALLAREAVRARGEAAESAAERALEIVLRILPQPHDHVSVRIHAPDWLPRARWEGREVPAAQARSILRELDGMHLGGSIVRVEAEPALRPGRAVPPWRSRAERQREIFSLWDRGIAYDDAGLFSATPEALAANIASRAWGVAIDATCGIGSIAIALARHHAVTSVVAIDLDEARLAMARRNAEIYGVSDRIRFVRGDAREIVPRERGDVLVVDPPWGGRDYDKTRIGFADLGLDVRALVEPFPGAVVLKLPRSFDVAELDGEWEIEPAIDARGVIKFLIARAS